MNRGILIAGLGLALTVPPLRATAQTLGTLLSHNGTSDSVPPGTGEVQIQLNYGTSGLAYVAHYYEVGTHILQCAYAPGSQNVFLANSYAWNGSGTPWAGLEITLHGADFGGWNGLEPLQASSKDPVVDVGLNVADIEPLELHQIGLRHWPSILDDFSLAGSTIARFDDRGAGFRDSRLTVLFDQPVLSGRSFVLHFNIIPSPGAAGETGFTAAYTTIPVPEPASLLLLAVGVIGFAALRT